MSGGDFLSRWSRRKREVAEREAELPVGPRPTQPAEVIPDDASRLESTESFEAGEAPALTPEEIARLPALNELGIDTDLTQFLRKGVPRVLRNAALRRMWSLDPSIRDYVSEAREYAYDWNVPGGVPGYGPLLPSDDVQAMLKRIIGGLPEPEDPAEAPRDMGIDEQAQASATAELQADIESEAAALPAATRANDLEAEGTQEPASLIPAGNGPPRNNAEVLSPVRRHGGAIPI